MIEQRGQLYFRAKLLILLSVSAVGLCGCGDMHWVGDNPVEMYRDATGVSAHDKEDKAAANSQNLAQGNKEPYPNLASVPAPPERAITKADREKLAQALIADRQNAQYTDQQLRAGQNMSDIPAPPPVVAAAPQPAPARMAGAPAAVASAPPKAAPRLPVKQETLAIQPRSSQIAAMPPASGAAPTIPDRTKGSEQVKPKKADDAKKKKPQTQAKRGSEKPPEESPLKSPTIGAVTEGDEAQPAPPTPSGVPRAVKPLARPERPAASQEVAAAIPPRSDMDAAPAIGPRGNVSVRAAQINFAPGPFRARIMPDDNKQLGEVVKLTLRNNGKIRVVGYGGAAAQGDLSQRQFQSFNAALDNAKAVALALTKMGVPANRIDIETVAKVNSPDRADVFVEY